MRLLLALLLIPVVAGQPMLSAVVPDLPGAHDGDEAVGLRSPTDWDLSGYGLSDGEDTWWFPPGAELRAGVEAWVVGNASAWAAFDGVAPSWAFDLQLGNGGDQVRLLGPEGEVDAMAYDRGLLSGSAQVLRGPDWVTPRIHKMGESVLDQPAFTAEAVRLFASPDSSHATLTQLIESARSRVHLHVYQLGEPLLVDALARAAARGVDVQVLVEDAPVGADALERAHADAALARIESSGGATYRAGSMRYAFHHLKVAVVDEAVVVQSENWVPSGVPVDPTWGNRGWGVVIEDGAAAAWFANWMQADRGAWDTQSADPRAGALLRLPAATGAYEPVPTRRIDGPVVVHPFISPDHTANPAHDPVLALVRNATHRIDVQQLDLRLEASNAIGWHAPDGLAVALAEAAERGVQVRVQAAAPFHAKDTGNQEVLAWLAARGVEVAQMDRPGIHALHNKGLIVDDRWVVIGSMNGNHHSRSNNREVGVILDSPAAAAYYGALFDADWSPPATWDGSQVLRDLEAMPASPWPMLFAVTLVAWLRRCSPPFPGSHSP